MDIQEKKYDEKGGFYMRIRWGDFELPTRVNVDKETYTNTYGRFVVEPFERGFGVTIGNSLKRILLSSIQGCSVVSVKIKGVKHEFSTIPGVLEDVTDIILNIKNLIVKMHSINSKQIKIEAKKKGVVKAKDIITDEGVEIVNEDLHIATIVGDANLCIEMEVRAGRGYKIAEEIGGNANEVDLIPIDAIFSPVRKVKIHTEETRVGRRTNYDRLIIEMWTNGVVSPEMALVEATKILRKHLNPFIHYFELGRELPYANEKLLEKSDNEKESVDELNMKLVMPVTELDLSVRASNCIEATTIKTLGDLVTKSEDELLELKNFGKTTLIEVKKKLNLMGLTFKTKDEQSPVGKEMIHETQEK